MVSAEHKRPNSPQSPVGQADTVKIVAVSGCARYSETEVARKLSNQGGTAENAFVPEDEGLFF